LESQQLLIRTPILDRNGEINFYRLRIESPDFDTITPLMLRLANADDSQAVFFIPAGWNPDESLLGKIGKNAVLVFTADPADIPAMEKARAAGCRIGLEGTDESGELKADFFLTPFSPGMRLTPNTIATGIGTPAEYAQAMSAAGLYLSCDIAALPSPPGENKRINPGQALILELMAAVQQEAEPKAIELMFKRDVALAFKLLRYINSPGFGLASRVESVRHALSIIGYQQLQKWLALLAVTAGRTASPAHIQTAIVRARLMELVGGKKLEKRDADNLFITGMLSLMDRITGAPLPETLEHANLPPAIGEALLQRGGKYYRFLELALACEGLEIPEAGNAFNDVDAKTLNIAHLESIEWAIQISRVAA
jgi:hypothetical protein